MTGSIAHIDAKHVAFWAKQGVAIELPPPSPEPPLTEAALLPAFRDPVRELEDVIAYLFSPDVPAIETDQQTDPADAELAKRNEIERVVRDVLAEPPVDGASVSALPPGSIDLQFDGETIELCEADRVMIVSAWIAGQGGAAVAIPLTRGQLLQLRFVDITRLMEAWHAA